MIRIQAHRLTIVFILSLLTIVAPGVSHQALARGETVPKLTLNQAVDDIAGAVAKVVKAQLAGAHGRTI